MTHFDTCTLPAASLLGDHILGPFLAPGSSNTEAWIFPAAQIMTQATT